MAGMEAFAQQPSRGTKKEAGNPTSHQPICFSLFICKQ
jgi:hypothetical protein